jgi:transposase
VKGTTLGIDLAKRIFPLHGADKHGKVAVEKRVTRSQRLETGAQLPPWVSGMEACARAQYWAREFQQLGHTVKLMSPQFVKPYVTGKKNDSRDAAARCEAAPRPHRRFVPLKTVEGHEIHAIHRRRRRLLKERTALVTQVRGLLAERGMVIARGMTRLRHQRPTIGEEGANKLTPVSREVRRGLYEELVALAERSARTGHFVQRRFAEHTQCPKLARSEGIGPVIATAGGISPRGLGSCLGHALGGEGAPARHQQPG